MNRENAPPNPIIILQRIMECRKAGSLFVTLRPWTTMWSEFRKKAMPKSNSASAHKSTTRIRSSRRDARGRTMCLSCQRQNSHPSGQSRPIANWDTTPALCAVLRSGNIFLFLLHKAKSSPTHRLDKRDDSKELKDENNQNNRNAFHDRSRHRQS